MHRVLINFTLELFNSWISYLRKKDNFAKINLPIKMFEPFFRKQVFPSNKINCAHFLTYTTTLAFFLNR